MGTGMNVQKRLVALHHLDAPWKPAEVEQREGRILRQGNENAEVGIYRYVTEASFDAFMWQALETKQKFISQVMTGESAVRRAEDIGGEALSYAEVKAIASGNPAVLTLAETDAELQRLSILRKNHADEQYLARRSIRELPEKITHLERRLAELAKDLQTLTAQAHAFERPDQETLGLRLKSLPEKVRETSRFALGRFHGLTFGLVIHSQGSREVYLEGTATRFTPLSRESHGPRAVLNALERLSGSYESERATAERDLGIAEGQLRDHKAKLHVPFAHERYLSELTELRDTLKTVLSRAGNEPGADSLPPAADLAERIKTLQASQTIEQAPNRQRSRMRAEAPVTSRIRRKTEPSAQDEETDSPPPQPAAASPHLSVVPVPAPEPEPTLDELTLPSFALRVQPRARPRPVLRTRFQPGRQLSLF
jgi:hypothetical protein